MPSLVVSVVGAIACVVALIVYVIVGPRRPSHRPDPRAIAWALPFCLVSILAAVLSALGRTYEGATSHTVLAVVTFAGTVGELLIQRRGRVHHTRHPHLLGVGRVAIAALLASLALEFPSNHLVLHMHPGPAALEVALVFAFLAVLFFGLRRRAVLAVAGVAALQLVGIAEYFVISFKAMPIVPGDLLALETATAVAGGYAYVLNTYSLYALAFSCAATFVLSLPREVKAGRVADKSEDAAVKAELAAGNEGPAKRDVESEGTASRPHLPLSVDRRIAVLAAAGLAAQALIDYYALGIQVYTWQPLYSYYDQGFIPAFVSGVQTMVPSKPRGYDASAADDLVARHAAAYSRDPRWGADPARAAAEAQFDELRPSILCIMNESFADLSVFDGLGVGYEGPRRLKALTEGVVARGTCHVSAFGGGTCNTEFEFLTGSSMAFLGSGVYPFTMYNLAPAESLVTTLSGRGWYPVATHPNRASNWNREYAYADLGFDRFDDIDAYQGAPMLCNKVTDAASYEYCLNLLRTSEGPVLIHDVTMQNHSGYDTGLVPADQRLSIEPPGTTAEQAGWVSEYCSLVEESDTALANLLDDLRALDRPVVVVFYGDHQPFFTDVLNDLAFTAEDDATHTARLWQTPYLVWANYDVAGREAGPVELDVQTGDLAALAMHLVGGPLTDWQRARLSVTGDLPQVSSAGWRDADGAWHLSDDRSGAPVALGDLEHMQYRKLFDHDGPVFATRRQTEANQTDAMG